jgi:hypothetical protein
LAGSDESEGVKVVTFKVNGDFAVRFSDMETRTAMTDEANTMTDLWVFDYKDGQCVQSIHQTSGDAQWGTPTLSLRFGTHQIYFVASRGAEPVVDADNHVISFGTVRDTFWKRYNVNVVATSNGNRAVTLDRVVTKLRLTFTDEVPATANSISIVPHTWYYGLDYTTGQPASVRTDAATVITIPDASKGQTGIQASLFGFSGADEWNTDVVISSRTSTDDVLGSATITSAPFKANRVSDYSGPLFSAGGSLSLSLNGEWEDSYQGSW